MILDKERIFARLDELKEEILQSYFVEFISEVSMKRVVRTGKIVRKVKVKRKGFKVVRNGQSVKFVKMTVKEKRARRKAAKRSWRVAKSARKNQSKRTLKRSKVRMKTLYVGKNK